MVRPITFLKFFVLPALALLSACSDPESQVEETEDRETSMASLSGSVLYRERMALPPGATVNVTLEDVSKMDAPATILATSSKEAEGGPPYPFTLKYDQDAIQENSRYGLRAKIEVDGKLMFTSTEFIPAFDEDREGSVEILVQRTRAVEPAKVENTPMDQNPEEDPSAATDTTLTGVIWTVTEIEGNPAQPGGQDKALDLTFADEVVSGFAGCNTFSGPFELADPSLTLGPLATTRKAAIDPAVAKQEQEYLAALAEVSEYAISGKKLMLKDDTGQTLIVCEAP